MMNPAYAPLFQTYTFNNGKTVKNRFVVAPMTHWSSDAHGHATPDELAYIKARSQGFGLFVTGSIAVSKQAISFSGQPLAINDDDLPSLKSVADTIKSGGALAIAQLQHGGAAVLPELNGGKILAPSSFKNKELETAYGKQLVTADGMSQDELMQTQADF
ncbi:MAG: NADH-dependent flavin oxidoreductase, partial [Neisseria sp.]|nr:NADH-dependent flavin oxidoreductase [Neisseria sp.]